MAISSFEDLGVRFELSSVEEVANISAPGPQIKKSKGILLSVHTCKISVETLDWPSQISD